MRNEIDFGEEADVILGGYIKHFAHNNLRYLTMNNPKAMADSSSNNLVISSQM